MKSPSPFITLAPGPGTGAAFVKYDKKALFTLVSIVGAVGVNSVSERLAMRIVPIVLLLTVLSAAQTDTRIWHVRIGTEGDTRLSVSSSAGVIEFRNDTAVVFTIPVASVTGIFHTRQQIRRSTQALNFFEGICCGGTDSHLLSALAFVVAAPLGSAKSDYVEIDWKSKGPGMVQLRPDDDSAAFMDWVSRLSGVQAHDLEQERSEVIQKIETAAWEAFPVCDQDCDNAEYQALRIEGNADELLYFFRGTVTAQNLISIFPVTEEAADNACVQEKLGRILRGKCHNGRCDIRAIVTRRYTYRPGSLPRTYTVGADGLSPSECPALAAQSKRVDSDTSETSRKTLRVRQP